MRSKWIETGTILISISKICSSYSTENNQSKKEPVHLSDCDNCYPILSHQSKDQVLKLINNKGGKVSVEQWETFFFKSGTFFQKFFDTSTGKYTKNCLRPTNVLNHNNSTKNDEPIQKAIVFTVNPSLLQYWRIFKGFGNQLWKLFLKNYPPSTKKSPIKKSP